MEGSIKMYEGTYLHVPRYVFFGPTYDIFMIHIWVDYRIPEQ